MRKLTVLFAAVLTLALPLAGHAQMKPKQAAPVTITPGAPGTALEQPRDLPVESARRISRAEATRLVAAGKAVFVDVRSVETFAKGHIKGAISIPQSKLPESLGKLPPKKMLITYCACQEEHTAALAVLFFNKHGISDAAALVGGWNAWLAAKAPVEGTQVR